MPGVKNISMNKNSLETIFMNWRVVFPATPIPILWAHSTFFHHLEIHRMVSIFVWEKYDCWENECNLHRNRLLGSKPTSAIRYIKINSLLLCFPHHSKIHSLLLVVVFVSVSVRFFMLQLGNFSIFNFFSHELPKNYRRILATTWEIFRVLYFGEWQKIISICI